ncbi:hypothetical protein GQ457_07G038020 [Hibiscus cannabinus]
MSELMIHAAADDVRFLIYFYRKMMEKLNERSIWCISVRGALWFYIPMSELMIHAAANDVRFLLYFYRKMMEKLNERSIWCISVRGALWFYIPMSELMIHAAADDVRFLLYFYRKMMEKLNERSIWCISVRGALWFYIPMSELMIHAAANDVRFLLYFYRKMMEKLNERSIWCISVRGALWFYIPMSELMIHAAADDVRFLLYFYRKMMEKLNERSIWCLSVRGALHCRCFCINENNQAERPPSPPSPGGNTFDVRVLRVPIYRGTNAFQLLNPSPHVWIKKPNYILIQQTTFRMKRFGMDEQIKEEIENEAIPKLSNFKKTFPIIGIVDCGVNINHESFHDKDIPDAIDGDEWNGGRLNVPYKRKMLASKCLIPTTIPRETFNLDVHGHGTKCASIAASSRTQLKFLEGIEGIPSATVSGANPDARIASYKVYGIEANLRGELYLKVDRGLLANAIQQAVEDKVDVLSISLAKKIDREKSYLQDEVNRSAYLAVKKNIVVCVPVGNDDIQHKVSSLAPWVINVGSCNSGGRFFTRIQLGSGVKIKGFGTFITEDGEDRELSLCPICYRVDEPPNLHRLMLVCKRLNCSTSKRATGTLVVGLVIDDCLVHHLHKPMVFFNSDEGACITSYVMNRTSNMICTVKILKSTFEEDNVCRISKFSGRGPNPYDAYLLKPDICAPGENILSAAKWDPTNLYGNYTLANGTSAATPMVAGMISYIRSIHPEWEPGRIKSSIMTTVYILQISFHMVAIPMQNNDEKDFMGFGAGRINPLKAINPGLVYDLTWDEYRRYMLGRVLDNGLLREMGENLEGPVISSEDLNLPSFSSLLGGKTVFNRVLTNVGAKETCTYRAKVEFGRTCPSCTRVFIKPTSLSFNGVGDKKHFELTIDTSSLTIKSNIAMAAYARLLWIEVDGDDKPHTVSSPIVMRTPTFG